MFDKKSNEIIKENHDTGHIFKSIADYSIIKHQPKSRKKAKSVIRNDAVTREEAS